MSFKKNMSDFDRLVRIIAAITCLSLFFIGEIRGVFGFFLIAVSVIFGLTGITSFCPLYKSTKFSTCKKSDDYI